jgi:putative Holliday junction resolvase
LGKGEEQTGGRERFSILGNLFESVVGAIYISEGTEAAKDFVLRQLGDELERAAVGESLVDYKSTLQERVQKEFGVLPTYRLARSSGPDHDKEFVVEVYVGETKLSEGKGKSKKQAEKSAAAKALEHLGGTLPGAEPIQGDEWARVESKPGNERSKNIPPNGRIMAIDPGERRIGVALSDELRLIAQPLTTIENVGACAAAQRIAELVTDHQVKAVVVGLPRGLDGREGASASLARKIGDEVRKSVNVPVVFWDERLSTVASERHLIETGVRRKDRREIVDQYAAAWILEGYLEHLRQSTRL